MFKIFLSLCIAAIMFLIAILIDNFFISTQFRGLYIIGLIIRLFSEIILIFTMIYFCLYVLIEVPWRILVLK